MTSIPKEYQPQDVTKTEPVEDHDTGGSLFALFDHDDDDDDQNMNTTLHQSRIPVGSVSFLVQQPPDKGTLFAHQVWSGSRYMAQYLLENPALVQDKSTIEFGAGTALPSLAALKSGSSFSAITDYPDEDMLQAIRETVGYNWNDLGNNVVDRVAVIGHEWGTSTKPMTTALAARRNNSPQAFFDVALLSECLWNHSLHEKLAASLQALLHPAHGCAIFTYAHHIPGLEDHDDAFFTLCEERYGFQVATTCIQSMPYMWDATKTIPILLKIMVRQGNGDSGSTSN